MIKYVDFDGTLAKFDTWRGPEHFGDPVPEMVKKVKKWIVEGDQVVIFTARMTPGVEFGQTNNVEKTKQSIEKWCLQHLGIILPVTNIKSYADVYYDDKCCRIIPNTGLTIEETIVTMIRDALLNNIDEQIVYNRILKLLKEVRNDI